MGVLIKFFKKNRFFSIVLLCFLFTTMLFYGPIQVDSFYEPIYKGFIYGVVRFVLDITLGALPFNAFWPVLIIALSAIGFQIYLWIMKKNEPGIHARQILRILAIPLLILTLFYWLWGFHYKGENLTDHLRLVYRIPNEQRLRDEAKFALESMLSIRQTMGIDSSHSIVEFGWMEPPDSILYISANAVFFEFNLKTYGSPKVKRLFPKGFLHRLNTSGFYNPITGECNVEADLHPLLFPFVKAHEWTHSQGITDEGDANFLAYWICTQSKDLYFQYSGHLTYWRYLMRDIRRNYPELYEDIQKSLMTGIKKDLEEIRANLFKYPEFMPKTRDVFYNSYLKTHGIKEGMDSYNRIVKMVIAYKRQKQI